MLKKKLTPEELQKQREEAERKARRGEIEPTHDFTFCLIGQFTGQGTGGWGNEIWSYFLFIKVSSSIRYSSLYLKTPPSLMSWTTFTRLLTSARSSCSTSSPRTWPLMARSARVWPRQRLWARRRGRRPWCSTRTSSVIFSMCQKGNPYEILFSY